MRGQPKYSISNERATDLLKNGEPLLDVYINGELIIETNENWDKEVVFENCIVDFFSGSTVQFDKPVRLVNSHFKKCQFTFSYFLGGLTIDSCTFDDYLDFQAGGHNQTNFPVKIINNEFIGFVNFFDCWYENEVIISDNRFKNGTNLLGNPNGILVTFDKEPVIKGNTGKVDFDNEGERNENQE